MFNRRCDAGSSNTIEGTFKHLEGRAVPQSGDVVFIVEAKSCNEDMLNKKNMQLLIQSLSKEFISNGFTRNRYFCLFWSRSDTAFFTASL